MSKTLLSTLILVSIGILSPMSYAAPPASVSSKAPVKNAKDMPPPPPVYSTPEQIMEYYKMIEAEANNGSAEAQFTIGNYYLGAAGPNISPTKALMWYTKSAEQNYLPAQNQLANLYATGSAGVPVSIPNAIKWYKRAVAQNSPEAMDNLAAVYIQNPGTTKDNGEIVSLFQRSANLGYSYAQFHYGVVLAEGVLTTKNAKEAYKWGLISEQNNTPGAAQLLEDLKVQLSNEEIRDAKIKANDWVASYKQKK